MSENKVIRQPLLFLLFFLFIIGTGQNAFAHGGGHEHEKAFDIILPDVVAKVNDTDISKEPIEEELGKIVSGFATKGKILSTDQQTAVAKRLIEAEISRTLLVQEAKEKGVKVSPEQTKKSGKSTRALLADALLEQEIGSKIIISTAEAKKFYENNEEMFTNEEKVRASLILIKVNPKNGSSGEIAAREEIDKLADKIKRGADFSAVAKESSQDSLAKKGGDLGYIAKDTKMPAEFKNHAFGIEVGSVSEVFRTRHGFHLLKVTDKKPGGLSPFENEKEKIEQALKNQEIRKRMPEYVQVLRKKADVKTYF